STVWRPASETWSIPFSAPSPPPTSPAPRSLGAGHASPTFRRPASRSCHAGSASTCSSAAPGEGLQLGTCLASLKERLTIGERTPSRRLIATHIETVRKEFLEKVENFGGVCGEAFDWAGHLRRLFDIAKLRHHENALDSSLHGCGGDGGVRAVGS